jgi:DNA-binding transcriptional LysR family regulator
VAECLSFTEAAKCLFITQPALSRQISVMEEELGTQLFVRDKKRLKLTPGGILLYNRLPKIMEDYNKAIYDARTANEGYEGQLRIGFLDIYDISELFTGVLHEFQQKYKKIQMSLERYSLGELPQRLQEDRLDLILTYGFSLYDQPQLMTVDIQKFDSYIMMNASHPLAVKEDLCLEDLKEELFVQLAPNVCEEGHRFIMKLLEKSGIRPNLMSVNKMEDVMLWVQTGNAVAITTNRTIESQNPNVILREIDMEEAKGHDITMAWRKNNYNPAITIFMNLLENTGK